jgi:hypothetical protein
MTVGQKTGVDTARTCWLRCLVQTMTTARIAANEVERRLMATTRRPAKTIGLISLVLIGLPIGSLFGLGGTAQESA